MSTMTTGTRHHAIASASTSDRPPDPVVQAYAPFVDGKTIVFEQPSQPFRYGRSRRKRYVYYIDNRQLWRVLIRNGKKMQHVQSWRQPLDYIRAYDLKPVWPKFMLMDLGL